MNLSEQRNIAEEILQLIKKRQMDIQRFRERIHHLAEQKVDKTFYTGNHISDEEKRILKLSEVLAQSIRDAYPNENFDGSKKNRESCIKHSVLFFIIGLFS